MSYLFRFFKHCRGFVLGGFTKICKVFYVSKILISICLREKNVDSQRSYKPKQSTHNHFLTLRPVSIVIRHKLVHFNKICNIFGLLNDSTKI